MSTKYQPIPGHPGYRAGDDGTIWSCWKGKWGIGTTWKKLSAGTNNSYGRQIVSLGRGSGSLYVHHLVLLAFVGPCPKGMECLHKDSDAGNNCLKNLKWGTPAENDADMRQNGLKKGERHHNAIMTNETVREVRRRARAGETHQQIADSMGIQRRNVGRIADGSRWSHVT